MIRRIPFIWALLIAAAAIAAEPAGTLVLKRTGQPDEVFELHVPAATQPTTVPTTQPAPPPPVVSAKPGPHNTGVRRPELLVKRGTLANPVGLRFTTDGQVVENLDLVGAIFADANNIIVRNCRIHGTSSYAVKQKDGCRGLIVEDCEITGTGNGAVYQDNYTARRLYLHNMNSDGFQAAANGNVTIEGCYVTKLGMAEGAHADGIQCVGGANHTFRGNNFDMPWGYTEGGQLFRANNTICVSYISGQPPLRNVLIEGNWLNGCTITVKVNGACTVRNNLFGRDYSSAIRGGSEAHLATWENNRWMDTNALIP